MARIEKTVFISYRRADRWPALAVFKDLTQHGYDVFVDYDGIASGDFESAIVDNIRARAHFVLLLTPAALERCDEPTDWLRREIETALESRRNIVPLLLDGFTLESPIAVRRLQGSLAPLRRYQALRVPDDYFDDAMARLRSRYLAVAVETVLHPASRHAQLVADEQRAAAVKASADAPASEKAAAEEATVHPGPRVAREAARPRTAATMPDGDRAAAGGAPPNAKSKASVRVVLGGAAMAVVLGLGWAAFHGGKKEETVPAPASASLPADSASSVPAEGPTDAAAQTALGTNYFYGQDGYAQNDAAAVKWYRRAAEQGDASGQRNLGFMYEHGRGGLARNEAEAVKWYRKAAEQGLAGGQSAVGFMHELGRGGLAKDDAEAVRWYRKAAEQGDAQGQSNLGLMYEQGRGGLAKDDAEAVKWYRKAAEQGQAPGQAYLADMYERGVGGLTKDRAEALKLYRQAAAQGNDYAKSALRRLGET